MLGIMTIQFRLKELIARHERLTGEKLTYRGLATLAGITPKMVNDVANQKVKHIGLTTIDRLCEALDVEPGELIVRVK
jgi:DNA-binding Xre family transcriptional regulator